MFFTRRRWALRVIEKMELRSTDQLATEIVSMIIQGSKQFSEMDRQVGSDLSKQEQILMAAAALNENHSAIHRLTNEFDVSYEEAQKILMDAQNAAYELATENDFKSLLNSSWFKQ